MAAQIFSESGQLHEVDDDIPDIFDVLEGGEDDNAVKYLLGYDERQQLSARAQADIAVPSPASATSSTQSGESSQGDGNAALKKQRDTSGLKAIYACGSCAKAFTTKFNLKRHINMHCHKSKEAGVPVQGPPSANAANKKPLIHRASTIMGLPRGVRVSKGQLIATNSAAGSSLIHSSLASTVTAAATVPTFSAQKPQVVHTAAPGQPEVPNARPAPAASVLRTPTAINLIPNSSLPTRPLPSTIISQSPCTVIHAVNETMSDSSVSAALNSAQAVIPSPPVELLHQEENPELKMECLPLLTTAPSLPPMQAPTVAMAVSPVAPSSEATDSSGVQISNTTKLAEALPNFTVTVNATVLKPPTEEQSVESSVNSKPVIHSPNSGSKMEKTLLITATLDPKCNASNGKVQKSIDSMPPGWVRKVVRHEGELTVIFLSPTGKKISSPFALELFFSRVGSVVAPGVFDWEVSDVERREIEAREQKEIEAKCKPLKFPYLPKPTSPFGVFRMPSKRRLSGGSSVADGDESGHDVSTEDLRPGSTSEPTRKKKKIDPAQQMQSLFDFIRKYRKEDGTELCEPFIRAPKRRTEPKYYEVVSDPIDMLRIHQNLKMDEYASIDDLKADICKLIENARKYYEPDSDEYTAAVELEQMYEKALEKINQGEDPLATLGGREEPEDDITDMLEELLGTVVMAADKEDPARSIHVAFRLLPSKNRYPEYYTVIKDPLDLKTVACRIQNRDYRNLTELEDDLMTVFKNAMTFNEPGSKIYRDAKALAKLIKSKKYELEISKTARENRGARSSRRSASKRHYSAELADLQYPDSESEEESEEGDAGREEDPLWILYYRVRRFETPSGVKLYEPFLTLPSKRELPDYYLHIQEPISLNQIRKKLKAGEYQNDLDKLVKDMDLMFENCKDYNRPESRLYKEACKLQKIMQQKVEELQLSSEEEDEDVIMDAQLRKRLRMLYMSVLNYKNRDGIELIDMFMEKPSPKDYPDYYEVISKPMDMATINEKIKKGIYSNELELIQDMKLMFSNCRQYNEEGSDIYDDAIVLEKVLIQKAKDMGIIQGAGRGRPRVKGLIPTPTKSSKTSAEKIKILFDTLKDHKDGKGRQLSIIFLHLPSPKEFPDYFEVIKSPIDFERINNKIKLGAYHTLDQCLADFVIMFDNACQYNEPDSQIYKDALTLQSLAHKTCRSLNQQDEEAGGAAPNVAAAVQEILSSIFISMYNYQDAEERCFSDSLTELPEHDLIDGKKVRALSLDLIKRRLDKGLYKRLDSFQRDVFAVLERARKLTRSDSQVFEDSVELQTHFIKVRDETCGNGNNLQSKALLYTLSDLATSVENLKAQKAPAEMAEDEEQKVPANEGENAEGSNETSGLSSGQQQYHVGEFVYVETDASASVQSIYLIEKIFSVKEGQAQEFYGNAFYRPEETFHVPTRKFLEHEVFRTDVHATLALDKIVGRCVVVPVRDYFRMKPDGFTDKDIFVCESRYSSKARSFKKMKLFWDIPPHIQLVARETPIEPKRIMSIFKERVEKHKEELEEIENMVANLKEDLPPNVIWLNHPEPQEGCLYYEQFTIAGPITLRRGDTVYVRSENGKNLIAQIDTMWKSQTDDMAYFNGPWYVTPKETVHPPTHMFYKQEVLLSTISDTNPLLSIVGKCSVMELRDYMTSRSTQYAETDVFLCESVYDESKRLINKGALSNGMKQYEHSTSVQSDEVYNFKSSITPQKEPSPNAKAAPASGLPASALPGYTGTSYLDIDNEDSMDGTPASAGSDSIQATPGNKKAKSVKKTVTAYILYAAEIRKLTTDENKDCSFGEISRIVGLKKAKSRPRTGYQLFSSQEWVRVKTEMNSTNFANISREIGNQWKQLPDAEKQIYEEKAKKLNEENAKLQEEKSLESRAISGTQVVQSQVQAQGQPQAWAQGQVQNQALRPTLPNGTTATAVGPQNQTVHIVNGQAITATGRPVTLAPAQRNRASSQGFAAMTAPIEPIFHTVPSRTQKLLHSEAYYRYIEGLSSNSNTISNWDRQLSATKENTRTDEAKLPAHWLSSNGDHGTSLDALWALRDFMLQDSLQIPKYL